MWGWVTTWRHGEAPGHRWAQLTPPPDRWVSARGLIYSLPPRCLPAFFGISCWAPVPVVASLPCL